VDPLLCVSKLFQNSVLLFMALGKLDEIYEYNTGRVGFDSVELQSQYDYFLSKLLDVEQGKRLEMLSRLLCIDRKVSSQHPRPQHHCSGAVE